MTAPDATAAPSADAAAKAANVPAGARGGETTGAAAPFYGRPFLWLLFALVLLAIPAAAAMWRAGMPWTEIHPAINAMLNGTSAVFLIAGFTAIRRRQIQLHRACMLAAVTASSL